MTTVDRIRWIEQRIRHLEAVRDDESQPDDHRAAAEAEIQRWRADARYRWHWPRRVFGRLLGGDRASSAKKAEQP
ncbi:MAG: hypothetical protein JO054_00730 [Actinobacteria bacterium]|nr:hypothetical protein [Actinomycetota bacterium]